MHSCYDGTVFVGRPVATQRHFQLAENRGERGAQLVRRISGKAPLPFERFLKPIEQAIERSA